MLSQIRLQEFIVLVCLALIHCRPTENERIRLWRQHGNTWPPSWQPESESFKLAMKKREREIMKIPGSDERWENWMQFTQGRLVPKFTQFGFEVVQTPAFVHDKLLRAVQKGVDNWDQLPDETGVDAIYGALRPKFVDIGPLAWEVLEDMKPYHERWAGGMELFGTSAYGVRLYQNDSSLVMHYDKIHSHVISSIVHIAHEYDDDKNPWPIQIEDHDGNIHSVALEAGQMLFYESAKALHGRMVSMRGKYYGSIFLHYQPVDRTIWDYTVEDVIALVPPHWHDSIKEAHGSRWAGQGITADSVIAEGAPPRFLNVNPPRSEL